MTKLSKLQSNSRVDFPGGSEVKAFAYKCGRPGFDPWVRKIPWRRKWPPTPVFLPGESHGRRSLVGYSPRGHKGSDTTEQLHFHQIFKEEIMPVLLKEELKIWRGRKPPNLFYKASITLILKPKKNTIRKPKDSISMNIDAKSLNKMLAN